MDAQEKKKKALFRSKLNAKKKDTRIDSPLVRYNESDQPVCRVCNVVLKSESLWDVHQASRKHHEAINNLKASAAGTQRGGKPVESQPKKLDTSAKSSKSQTSSGLLPNFFENPEPAREVESSNSKNLQQSKPSTTSDTKMTKAPLPDGFLDNQNTDSTKPTSEPKQSQTQTTNGSDTKPDWSKLCPDLLQSIFDSLSTKDFHRARSVCPDWYSVSERCTRELYPWRIVCNDVSSNLLFGAEEENSTLLFDPAEDKFQKIEHPRIELQENYVIATCGSWLLMVGSDLGFYILNVFTRERITIPSVMPNMLGQASFKRKDQWQRFIERIDIISSKPPAVLWINQKTHDYFVAWSYKEDYLFTYKKGDRSWYSLEGIECISMGYKNQKLYIYTFDHFIKVFHLAGDSSQEIIENPYSNHRFDMMKLVPPPWKRRIAITNSEEVVIILSLQGTWKPIFSVYKLNSVAGNWERIHTLGGEISIFGNGVTLRALVKTISGGGIKGDSIFFLDEDLGNYPSSSGSRDPNRRTNCGIFDLVTSTITWPKTPDDAEYMNSIWFSPEV